MQEKKALSEENEALEQEKRKLMQQVASLQAKLAAQDTAPVAPMDGDGSGAIETSAATPRGGWVALHCAADAASARTALSPAAAAPHQPGKPSAPVSARLCMPQKDAAPPHSPVRVTSASIISMSDQLQAALQSLQTTLAAAAEKLSMRSSTEAATQELSNICLLLRRQLVKTVGPRASEMEATMRSVLEWAQDAQVRC